MQLTVFPSFVLHHCGAIGQQHCIGAMPKGVHFRLRFVLAKLREELRVRRGSYPSTTAALAQLEAALEAEFPQRRATCQQPAACSRSGLRVQMHRQRCSRLHRRVDELEAQLAKHTAAKLAGGRLSEDCYVRVFLASPVATGRALARSFRDILGPEGAVVSRRSMENIRDTWVEMYKKMVLTCCAEMVAAGAAAARQNGRACALVFLKHCQDECDARLRSGDPRDGPKVPRRGRASKVQQHVLRLAVGSRERDVPSELEALGDKTAGTLATSFERILRSMASNLWPAALPASPETPETWFIHVLVGDGINTNEAAAKILWSCMSTAPLSPNVRYFLILVKCATHQAALSAKAMVEGVPAKIAGGELHVSLVGTAVRLFKYVLCDYFEEVCAAVQAWVEETLEVVDSSRADISGQKQTAALHELYTDHVLPNLMLALFNNGLDRMSHIVGNGKDPVKERPLLVGQFAQFFVTHMAHVDSCPTPNRFFTFRAAVDRMTAMHLVSFPKHALQFRRGNMREESQKRVKRILAFFNHAEAGQLLRRTSLCFQITGGVEALVTAQRQPSEPPLAVRLCKGEADDLVRERLQRIFGCMPLDSFLQIGPAAGALLGTATDLYVRMGQFKEYPTRLVKMSLRWFPESSPTSCDDFLFAPESTLDVGVGVPLQRLAWQKGGNDEIAAKRWLLSREPQELFDAIADHLFYTSIEVERRHSEVKNWNPARKVAHIATVSRNAIILRFNRWREAQTRALEVAAMELRKAKRTTWTSLAWQEASAAERPVGVPFQTVQDEASLQASPETSAERSAPSRSKAPRVSIDTRRDLERRAKGSIAAAQAKYDGILATCVIPATRQQWEKWLREHWVEFQEARKCATPQRRLINFRLRARAHLPAPAARFQPIPVARLPDEIAWLRNLQGRVGWFGLCTSSRKLLIFLTWLRGRAYCVVLASFGLQGVGLKAANLTRDFDLPMRLQQLHDLANDLEDEVVRDMFQFKVTGRPLDSGVAGVPGGGICVETGQACRIRGPLLVARRKGTKRMDEDNDEGGGDISDLGSDSDLRRGSDLSDPECVLDTDVDSSGDVFDESDSASDIPDEGGPAGDARPADPGNAKPTNASSQKKHVDANHGKRLAKQPLWENGYFYIADNTGKDESVKIYMFDCWSLPPPAGMGRSPQMSKTLTPRHYSETRESPIRSFLLLRAWMLWRFAQHGWAMAERGRHRQYDEDFAELLREIRKLGYADRLLGNAEANKLLQLWVPELAATLSTGG